MQRVHHSTKLELRRMKSDKLFQDKREGHVTGRSRTTDRTMFLKFGVSGRVPIAQCRC